MINILYISHYPDLKMGGQQSMYALINQLDRKQFSAFAIVPQFGELYDRLTEIGCKVFVVPLVSLKPKHILRIISNIFKIYKLIKHNNIDIIHPDHERDSIVAGIAKLFTKTKMIWHVRLTRKVETDRLSVSLADGIIGIANDVWQRFAKFNSAKSKYTTIYNGVDCDIFKPIEAKDLLKDELGLPKDQFLITFVGQFKRGKGILDIIGAAEILLKRYSGVKKIKFLMIGSVIEKVTYSQMLEMINSQNLNDIVEIIPQQQGIHRYMQVSEILLLPSHEGTEGMGRVIFESLACGTPVVATDVLGVREALTTDTGILVNEKSPVDLSNAIAEYIDDDERRILAGRNGRNRALIYFDIKIHTQKVQLTYSNLMKYGKLDN